MTGLPFHTRGPTGWPWTKRPSLAVGGGAALGIGGDAVAEKLIRSSGPGPPRRPRRSRPDCRSRSPSPGRRSAGTIGTVLSHEDHVAGEPAQDLVGARTVGDRRGRTGRTSAPGVPRPRARRGGGALQEDLALLLEGLPHQEVVVGGAPAKVALTFGKPRCSLSGLRQHGRPVGGDERVPRPQVVVEVGARCLLWVVRRRAERVAQGVDPGAGLAGVGEGGATQVERYAAVVAAQRGLRARRDCAPVYAPPAGRARPVIAQAPASTALGHPRRLELEVVFCGTPWSPS